MLSPISSAIKQICEEKGIAESEVLEAIESALAAAYRKDFGAPLQNVKVKFNPETGAMEAYDVKLVVEDALKEKWEELRLKGEQAVEAKKDLVTPAEEEELRFNPRTHITLSEARTTHPKIALAEEIKAPLPIPSEFGRVAAQTAKQVIIQKLKEAERVSIYNEFKAKEGTVVSGTIGRREREAFLVDIGKATAILPLSEQIVSERYPIGNRLKFLVRSVSQTVKGPEIIVSRASPEFVKAIFVLEIPEVSNGTIEFISIAREPGMRTKIAVKAKKENLDPVGSCIGQRGVRVQTVMAEIGGEKIDVIEWSEDPMIFITRAFGRVKISKIITHPEEKAAEVIIPEDQLSLAIGRGGQNVRLASALTGWQLDIKGEKGGEIQDMPEENGGES
jgi:N utilization substance protein A